MVAKAIKKIPDSTLIAITAISAGEGEELAEELGEGLSELECPATSAAEVSLTVLDKAGDGEEFSAVGLSDNGVDAVAFAWVTVEAAVGAGSGAEVGTVVEMVLELIVRVTAESLTAELNFVGTGDNADTPRGTAMDFAVVCTLSAVLVGMGFERISGLARGLRSRRVIRGTIPSQPSLLMLIMKDDGMSLWSKENDNKERTLWRGQKEWH